MSDLELRFLNLFQTKNYNETSYLDSIEYEGLILFSSNSGGTKFNPTRKGKEIKVFINIQISSAI